MSLAFHCRAYPDEKGIETIIRLWYSVPVVDRYCRAYPDEKGIETLICSWFLRKWISNCRAYPDEKGIETITGRGASVAIIDELQSLSR